MDKFFSLNEIEADMEEFEMGDNEKRTMGIFTKVDAEVFNAVVLLANQYAQATTAQKKSTIRDIFDRYIDSLFDERIINDNQHQFLELWLVFNTNTESRA